MKKIDKLKILDCTLRDGGYYNKWDFDLDTVQIYLDACKDSLVDFVEIGFRSFPVDRFMGPYFYSSDEFINHLNLPEGPNYGVMINGKEFINDLGGNSLGITKLFDEEKNSPITLVRIAINFNQVLQVRSIASELKNKGYMVALNMMQASDRNNDEYVKISKTVDDWQIFDALYFADSLGNMVPADVKNISRCLSQGWSGPLGIHTHNNKNMALINSITAVENGVTWCDGTVTGMGRGAGNVATESLVLEMNHLGFHKGNANMMLPTVKNFTKLKNKYGWGSNLYYHYASNHGIHPTFVQSMIEDRRYGDQQVLNALEFLSKGDSTDYSPNVLRQAIYGNKTNINGTWDATGWINGQEVLIVGAGSSVKQYNDGILQYIKKNNPFVLFLNINRFLPSSLGSATVISHETRAIFDSQQYHNLQHPIILPVARLGQLIKEQLKGLEIFDYGLTLEPESFSIYPRGCSLQWPLAAAYALAISTQASASKISLVGFDGYNANDPRQDEMNDVFYKYNQLKRSIPIVSLTPTTYRINQSSIFSPSI